MSAENPVELGVCDINDLPELQVDNVLPLELRREFGGGHPRVKLPARRLAMLPQMREGSNPRLGEIQDSIDVQGMINDINVARIDRQVLAQYIAFTNAIWGVQNSVEQYADCVLSDGTILLVIAGHTRLTASLALAERNAEHYAATHEIPRDQVRDNPLISATVYENIGHAEILAIQLAENLHHAPSGERRAMAIVESYEYGKSQGQWTTICEFAEQNHGLVSESMLKDALAFSRLPPEMRTFVFHGTVSYTAAVLLGRAVPYIADRFRSAVELNTASAEDQASLVKNVVMAKMSEIQSQALRGVALKAHMKAWTDSFRPAQRAQARQEALHFEMYTTEEQVRMEIERARAEYLHQLDALVRSEHEERVKKILDAHRVAGLNDVELGLILDRVDAYGDMVRAVGKTSVASLHHSREQDTLWA